MLRRRLRRRSFRPHRAPRLHRSLPNRLPLRRPPASARLALLRVSNRWATRLRAASRLSDRAVNARSAAAWAG